MWIICGGTRTDGKEGFCDRKIARVLDGGTVEIQRRELRVVVSEGAFEVTCTNCGKPYPMTAPVLDYHGSAYPVSNLDFS
jgi:hypothetical protein